jgi:hypothetical protein
MYGIVFHEVAKLEAGGHLPKYNASGRIKTPCATRGHPVAGDCQGDTR